jgi:ankyrin repeat protein
MCAARNNRSDVVNFLLDTLEDIKVDAVDLEQQTALYHAALGGHVGIVRRLVEAGAKTESRNKVTLDISTVFIVPGNVYVFCIKLDFRYLYVKYIIISLGEISGFDGGEYEDDIHNFTCFICV